MVSGEMSHFLYCAKVSAAWPPIAGRAPPRSRHTPALGRHGRAPVPTTADETTVRRLHGFQRELIETLSKQLKNDPANETLLEARSLLENPWLRVPKHRR